MSDVVNVSQEPTIAQRMAYAYVGWEFCVLFSVVAEAVDQLARVDVRLWHIIALSAPPFRVESSHFITFLLNFSWLIYSVNC